MGDGQRSPDEVTVRVAATVTTLDEALTWVVRQVDARGLGRPVIAITPVYGYPPDAEQGEWFYEVSVCGEAPSHG